MNTESTNNPPPYSSHYLSAMPESEDYTFETFVQADNGGSEEQIAHDIVIRERDRIAAFRDALYSEDPMYWSITVAPPRNPPSPSAEHG